MVIDGETGLLATDDQWFEAFSFIPIGNLAESAYRAVLEKLYLWQERWNDYFEQN